MAGFVRMDPARIVLPASAALLAGMAWRVGWFHGSALGIALFCMLAPPVLFLAVMVISLPLLLVVVLAYGLVKAILRLSPGWRPMRAVPARPGVQAR